MNDFDYPNPHEDDLVQATGEIAGRLAEMLRLSGDPERVLAAFDQMAETLEAYGESPEGVAEIREALEADPYRTLIAMGAGAARHGGHELQVEGDDLLIFDRDAGRSTGRLAGALNLDVEEGEPEAPSKEAIEMLKRDPWLAGDFDAKFGRGAAAHVLERP